MIFRCTLSGAKRTARAKATASLALNPKTEKFKRTPKILMIPKNKMKVKELKKLLHQYGVSEVEAVEKEELIEVIYALQRSAVSEARD